MTPTRYTLLKTVNFPLEAAILLLAGLTMLVAGVLLFPISTGALPYYENGLYGLAAGHICPADHHPGQDAVRGHAPVKALGGRRCHCRGCGHYNSVLSL